MRTGILLLIGSMTWSASAQEVRMPLKDFEVLRAKAKPVAEPDVEAPVAWVLERVDLEMDLRGDAVHTRQIVDLVLWAEGWQEIPLSLVGTPLEVDWGDLEGRLDVSGSLSAASLKARGRGRHRVVIRSVTDLDEDEEAERPARFWRFRSPTAAVVGGFVQGQGPDEEIAFGNNGRIAPGQGLLKATETTGKYALNLVRGREVELRVLGPRTAPDLEGLPLRLTHELVSILEVSRTRVALRASVLLRVFQGRLESSGFSVPEGFEVTSVEGHHQGWDVNDDTLTVFWPGGRKAQLSITVEMMGPASDRVQDPILRPIQGEVSRHLVMARARGDGLLELENADVMRSATAEEKKTAPVDERAGGRALALRDPADGPVWTVVWADSARVLSTQVDRLLVDVLVGRSGKAAYQIWAEVRNRGSRLLKIQPPAGFRWVSASRDGSPLVPGLAQGSSVADGNLVVAVDSGDQSRAIHLVGMVDLSLPGRDGVLNLPIPQFSAPVARVEIRVSLPPGYEYSLKESSRRGEVGSPPRRAVDRHALLQTNQIASQLAQYVPEATVNEGDLWLLPSGFSELEAVWSALSPSPQPLQIQVERQREDSSWF